MSKFRNYINDRAYKSGLQSLMTEASQQIHRAEKLYEDYIDVSSAFLYLASNSEKGFLQEIDDEDREISNNITTYHDKLKTTFYRILKYGDVEKLEQDLNKEICLEHLSDTGQLVGKKDYFTPDKYKLTDFGFEKYNVHLVEIKTDSQGKYVKDGKDYVAQLVIEGRDDLNKFLPVFQELMREEDNFDSLREALNNIQEIILYTKKSIDHFSNRCRILKLENSEEMEDIQVIEEHVQKYSELKSQI